MIPIKMKAKQLAKQYQYPLMVTILYVGLYETFRDLLMQLTGVLGIIIAIACITLEHGKITAGLKVVDEKGFNPQLEAAVGIKRIKDLFSTYGCIMVINFVLTVIGVVAVMAMTQSYFMPLIEAVEAEMNYGIQNAVNQVAGSFILIVAIIGFIVELIVNTLFFSAPYLIETQQLNGLKAIKEAFKISKNNFMEVIKFQIHYALYMISFMCLEFLITYYINAPLLVSFLTLALTMISIFVYEMEFVVAKALLFHQLTERSSIHDFINE